MPAYHSQFNDLSNLKTVGNLFLLPIKTKIKGPAPPMYDDGEDIVEEAISLFRANCFFRNYEIQGNADRIASLARGDTFPTLNEASKALNTLALSNFALPGEPNFPMNAIYEKPKDRSDGDLMRSYLTQLRQELSVRLLDKVYSSAYSDTDGEYVQQTAFKQEHSISQSSLHRYEEFNYLNWTSYHSFSKANHLLYHLQNPARPFKKNLFKSYIRQLEQELSLFHFEPKKIIAKYLENSFVTNPPIIVLGTAGTGTRVINDILRLLNITMSKIVNRQSDSKIFIEYIKNSKYFSSINGQEDEYKHLNQTEDLFSFFLSKKSIKYEFEDLHTTLQSHILSEIQKMHSILSFEAYWKDKNPNIRWGFKEPQAMFILPILNHFYKILKNTSKKKISKLTIIHVIRDGRDIAFSKQQRKKYQEFYVNALSKIIPFTSNKTEYFDSIAISKVWEEMNLFVAKFCIDNTENIHYAPIRLEDLCRPKERSIALYNFMAKLSANIPEMYLNIDFKDRLSFFNNIVKQLGEKLDENVISEERCHLMKYKNQTDELVQSIEKEIEVGLKVFSYPLIYNSNDIGRKDLSFFRFNFTNDNIITQNITHIDYYPQKENLVNLSSLLEKLQNLAFYTVPSKKWVVLSFATVEYSNVLLNYLLMFQLSTKSLKQPTIVLILTNSPLLSYIINSPSWKLFEDYSNHNFSFSMKEKEIMGFWMRYSSLLDNFRHPYSMIKLLSHSIYNETCSITSKPFCNNSTVISNRNIWLARLETIQTLLENDYYVIASDIDAIWKDNFIELANEIMNSKYDIIASRGRFPYELKSIWGATICMGLIAFRPSYFALQILKRSISLFTFYSDDQKAFNRAIWETQPFWENTDVLIKEKKMKKYLVARYGKEKVNGQILIFPFSLVPRFCKEDSKFNNLTHFYSEAFVIHCYTPKSGVKKEMVLKSWGLWYAFNNDAE